MPRPQQGILKGGVWTLTGRSTAAAGAIVMNALIARLIPADAFGAYVLASSLTLFGAMVACAGLHRGAVRLIASYAAKLRYGEVAWIILLTLAVGLLFSIAVGGLSFGVLGHWLTTSVFNTTLLAGIPLILAIWLVLRTLQALQSAIFRGLKDMRAAAVLDGALPTLLIIAGLSVYATVAAETTFNGVMTIIVAGTGGGILVGLVLIGRSAVTLGKPKRISGREVTSIALPLFVATTMLFGFGEAHIWVLGALRPEEDVALFGAAQRLVKFVSFPLLIINAVLPPYVASIYAQGKTTRLQTLLQSAATLCALPSLLIVLVLVFFATPVMGLVYGSFYEAGALALIILSLAHGLNVATGSPGILLAMSDRQSQLMWIALATGLLGLIISLISIPRFGVAGAAVGAGVGVSLHNIVMWAYARRRLNIRTEMSVASVTFLYWNTRRRLNRLKHDSSGWRRLEGIVAGTERAYWRMRGYVVVECIGDSHANVFNHLNATNAVANMRFHVTAVRGATAFGLANPNSSTNAFQIFSETIDRLPANHPVILVLGEVDLGFIIWIRAQAKGLVALDVMRDALQRYKEFLTTQTRGLPVAVLSAPLPTIGDDAPQGEVAKIRTGVEASQSQRTQLTLTYNRELAAICRELNLRFIDLDPVSYDQSTGLVSSRLLRDNPADHHYDTDTYTQTIAKQIESMQLANYFRKPGTT